MVVGTNKSTPSGIIIAALEVIEACFLVADIAAGIILSAQG